MYEEMVWQARRKLPDESCGYLLGIGETVEENYPMTNADHSPAHFSFLPQDNSLPYVMLVPKDCG